MCFIALMDLHLLFDMMIVGICFCMLQILNGNRTVFGDVILHQVYCVISLFLFLVLNIGKVLRINGIIHTDINYERKGLNNNINAMQGIF